MSSATVAASAMEAAPPIPTLAECLRRDPRFLRTNLGRESVRNLRLLGYYRFLDRLVDPELQLRARLSIWTVSCSLSRRGIAPRWQNLPDPANARSPIVETILRADRPYFDLAWLALNYPDWRPKVVAWADLFRGRRLDPDILERIAQRAVSREKAVGLLALSDEMQLGCLYYTVKRVRQRWKVVQNALPKAEQNIRAEAKVRGDRSEERISARLVAWQCGRLTNWAPTSSARLRRMMTGEEVTRQSMAELLEATRRASRSVRRKKGK